MTPQGLCCWTDAPSRAALGPTFCCLNGSSTAREAGFGGPNLWTKPNESWLPGATCHQEPSLEISVKQKQPTSPLSHLVVSSFTTERNVFLKNLNSIRLTPKEWLVPEAGQLQWNETVGVSAGCQSNENSDLEMADTLKRWVPTQGAESWRGWSGVVYLMLCLGVCRTLWMLDERGWDFKRKAELSNLKSQLLFWCFL